MNMVSLGNAARVIAAVVLMGCWFAPAAYAQGRNEAVLNKEKKPIDPKHWVWRAKEEAASRNDIKAMIALVTPVGNQAKDAELRIWLYVAPDPGDTKLKLSESYDVFLDQSKQVNSKKGNNNSFHYKLETPITQADGSLHPSGATRTFIITATRERGNRPRTMRVTTFRTTNGETDEGSGEDGVKPKTVKTKASGPCTDYPDDAVLDEDEHSMVVIDDTLQPYPDEPWMTYP
jgi:hypothetical protein